MFVMTGRVFQDKETLEDDIRDNIRAGNGRVVTQRRGGNTILKTDSRGADMKCKGTWYAQEHYPHGDYKLNKRYAVDKADPVSGKKKKFIFVPDGPVGVYRG